MKKTIFIFFLFISSSVLANWTQITRSEQDRFFVDFTSLTKVKNLYRVWEKLEYGEQSEDKVRSVRMYMEYDCVEKKSRWLAYDAFDDINLSGKKIVRSDRVSEWKFIRIDTIENTIFNSVCKK